MVRAYQITKYGSQFIMQHAKNNILLSLLQFQGPHVQCSFNF